MSSFLSRSLRRNSSTDSLASLGDSHTRHDSRGSSAGRMRSLSRDNIGDPSVRRSSHSFEDLSFGTLLKERRPSDVSSEINRRRLPRRSRSCSEADSTIGISPMIFSRRVLDSEHCSESLIKSESCISLSPSSSKEEDSGGNDPKGALAGLAACLIMAGSPGADMLADSEVGALVASGHVDVMTAKLCTLPSGVVSAPPVTGSDAQFPMKLNSIPSGMQAFLSDVGSREADEAACLASGSFDEPESAQSRVQQESKTSQKIETLHVFEEEEEEETEEFDSLFSPKTMSSPKVTGASNKSNTQS